MKKAFHRNGTKAADAAPPSDSLTDNQYLRRLYNLRRHPGHLADLERDWPHILAMDATRDQLIGAMNRIAIAMTTNRYLPVVRSAKAFVRQHLVDLAKRLPIAELNHTQLALSIKPFCMLRIRLDPKIVDDWKTRARDVVFDCKERQIIRKANDRIGLRVPREVIDKEYRPN